VTATIATIRDRMAVLVTAIVPVVLAGNRLVQSRDEADFRTWCETNADAALRRFHIEGRVGAPPEFSMVDLTLEHATFKLTLAYPKTNRYGAEAGRDRDDAIDSDWRQINVAIGIYGRGNFSGANDCVPLASRQRIESGVACDFLVVEIDVDYWLDVDG
jgi:hypothetical protein